MCIAIYKPSDAPPLTREQLFNCFSHNVDGAGFMFIDHTRRGYRRLRINKGFFSFERFFQSYKYWEGLIGTKSPMVLHFRYATRGQPNKFNCHPFKAGPGQALVHNGVLNLPSASNNRLCKEFEKLDPTPDESDTSYYARALFPHYPAPWFHKDKVLRANMQKFIGKFNKIILMDWRGTVTILNKDEGHWAHGCWWSNYNYNTAANYTRTRRKELAAHAATFGDEDEHEYQHMSQRQVYHPTNANIYWKKVGDGWVKYTRVDGVETIVSDPTEPATPVQETPAEKKAGAADAADKSGAATSGEAESGTTTATRETQRSYVVDGQRYNSQTNQPDTPKVPHVTTPVGVMSSKDVGWYCKRCIKPLTRDLVGTHNICWECYDDDTLAADAAEVNKALGLVDLPRPSTPAEVLGGEPVMPLDKVPQAKLTLDATERFHKAVYQALDQREISKATESAVESTLQAAFDRAAKKAQEIEERIHVPH